MPAFFYPLLRPDISINVSTLCREQKTQHILQFVVFIFAVVAILGSMKSNPAYVTAFGILAAFVALLAALFANIKPGQPEGVGLEESNITVFVLLSLERRGLLIPILAHASIRIMMRHCRALGTSLIHFYPLLGYLMSTYPYLEARVHIAAVPWTLQELSLYHVLGFSRTVLTTTYIFSSSYPPSASSFAILTDQYQSEAVQKRPTSGTSSSR
ncbi:hypothetical protein EV421DRAFT_874129 [Armillaria borealis]|uniref:Uncharacterized protein n=1 Tax=Armillaria borealis TaxID=47425 RepID=A0AA39JCA6_9AGAR|nr:hypothetical protein EV421DRAFT_874129 [Armillaria borealis]